MSKRNRSGVLNVVEMFAGVGGFRQGLSEVVSADGSSRFEVVWGNQFEPSTKKQVAADIYKARWGDEGFVNRDINDVLADAGEMERIQKAKPDFLVAGFPCQDYSVAKPSNLSQGIEGAKGVLWWSIYEMLKASVDEGRPIKYALFENVDRLINSPSKARGMDFAIILSSLQSLGYHAEWRVVNSADYGFAQRRKRIFITAYHSSTPLGKKLASAVTGAATGSSEAWLLSGGVLAKALPVVCKDSSQLKEFNLGADVFETQTLFAANEGKTPFASSGICANGVVRTVATCAPAFDDFSVYVGTVQAQTLGHVVTETKVVPESFFIAEDERARWAYLKGAKSFERVSAGFAYKYSEGQMSFPDRLDKPSRTIITSEGGASASRTSHAVDHGDGRVRRLVPEELEALTGFPRGFTALNGVTDKKRAFLMGNSLVTGVVRLIGEALSAAHRNE
jgi:DNA (cytosine-5)-methyltransferase 1